MCVMEISFKTDELNMSRLKCSNFTVDRMSKLLYMVPLPLCGKLDLLNKRLVLQIWGHFTTKKEKEEDEEKKKLGSKTSFSVF